MAEQVGAVVAIPPILALEKNDTELLLFDTVDSLLEHDVARDHVERELFPSEGWDLFDVTGRRLTPNRDGSRIVGLGGVESTETPEILSSRIRAVVEAVKAKVQEGVQDGSIEERRLQEIAELDSVEGVELVGAVERLHLWRHPSEQGDSEDSGGWWHYMFSPHH